jgi:4-amino-4-deoxy-L-arabinose transferase-like glycosyltransferase
VTWWVVALTVAAGVLRFYRIGSQSLWVDELWTLKAAAVGGTLTAASVFTNVQGPAHAVLVHMVAAFSSSEAVLRGISALFGTATVPVVYRLGAAVVDRRTGLIAALLAVVSPFLLWYSQELRNYAMLIFFAAVATLAVWRLLSERSGPWVTYGVSIALAALSNLSAAFLAAAHWVFAFPRARKDRRFLLRWVVTFVLVLGVLSPWVWGVAHWVRVDRVAERVAVPGSAEDRELLRGETTFTPMAIPYSVFAMVYGYSIGPSSAELHTLGPTAAFRDHAAVVLGALALLAGAGISGLVVFWRDRLRLRLLVSTAVVPMAVVTLLAVLNIKVFNARYVAVMAPLVLVVLAAGIRRMPAVGAWFVGAGIVGLSLVGAGNYYWDPEYWREDVRSAARYIESEERDGDVVLVPVVTDVFDHYYSGGMPRFLVYPGQCGSDQEVAERVDAGTAGHQRLWLVSSRLWHADPAGRIPAYAGSRHELVQTASFPGVSVNLYELSHGEGEGASSGNGD